MRGQRHAVILAGGVGSRLAPISTPDFPKQFFRLPGEKHTLLQSTAAEALRLVPPESVWTVTSRKLAPQVREQVAEVHEALAENVLEEAEAQGTAYAAHLTARHLPKGSLWFLPCDHVRTVPLPKAVDVESAFRQAESERIVVFGAEPRAADSDFGYLQLSDGADGSWIFTEKPAKAKAEHLLAGGNSRWNSGMCVLPASLLLEALELDRTPLSLDHALMERRRDLIVHPFEDAGWDDIGSLARMGAWWRRNHPHVGHHDFGDGRRIARDSLPFS